MSLQICVLLVVFNMVSCPGAEFGNNISQHDYLIVSLTGKTVEQFISDQRRFQQLIVELATNFCIANDCQSFTEINLTTVQINNVVQCPSDWPDSSGCINVNLSVPVNSYELTNSHLRTMWRTHTPSQLSQLGLQDYEIPSDTAILILWLSITGVLCIIFIIILVLVMKTEIIENYIRRRRDILGSSNRSWLAPHRKEQLMPQFVYPDPPITKLKEEHFQNDPNRNKGQEDLFGIENPGYDTGTSDQNEKRLSQASTVVDDFDSEDDTIYPPSPPPIPLHQRNFRENPRCLEELETSF